MGSRLELQAEFEKLLGSRNVYYQPPASVKMSYPAIVYSRQRIENDHANNSVYMQNNAYSVTVIDKNPESEIVGKIASLPLCRFDRHYRADNLNHDVFTLYY
jgi:hypothetical protein